MRLRVTAAAIAAVVVIVALNARSGGLTLLGQSGPPPQKPSDLGFTDTPMIPGLPFRVHDPTRPHPKAITPGSRADAPPSDAIVLFDGRDLSQWVHRDKEGKIQGNAKWIVRDGYFEVAPKAGDLSTREEFGDVQLHIEWAAPKEVTADSQGRGNSGVLLMSLYEVQVLDSFKNASYADGQAGAIYGQWPPLVNAARPPGEWQSYDIVFDAPRFEGAKLARPAQVTVFWNGVMVHHRKEIMGATVWREVAKYAPHAPELPLMLQDHGNPVRFRNVWLRRLQGYDLRRSP